MYVLGAEITDCMMIGDTDSIFLSAGEAFISPSPIAYILDIAHKREINENNRMPAYVGMYNVGEILGSGAFGEVRLGTNKLTDEKVALKFLRKADIQSMGAAERTSNETQCLSSLSHRNIIKLFMVRSVCM
jgi:serine/threonine protein kinase